MCDDPLKNIELIASFLGLEGIDKEVIHKVFIHSSIDEMKSSTNIGLNHIRKGNLYVLSSNDIPT